MRFYLVDFILSMTIKDMSRLIYFNFRIALLADQLPKNL